MSTGDTWDEFATLDYDRNGSIARNEWHWSNVTFNQRDANRDGMLSRREFEMSGGAPGAVATSGRSRAVHVQGQYRWTDTGIDVRAGQNVTLDSSGTIQMSDNAQDTATPAGSTSGRRAPDAPILNQLAGALLGRIGDYGPIFLGNRQSFNAPVGGRLYLGINDDHLPDNRGEFLVNITTQ